MMIKGVLPLFCALALAAEESAPPKKGEPSVQIELQGGWFSFGTTFADEDEPEQFAPEDPEKEQMEGLKENLGDETFGAIAAATGMDKRPDSLSRDGAMKARNVRIRPFAIDPFAVSNEQFGRFVREKRYKTEAENYQWSFVLEAVASNATINETDRDGGLGRVRDSPWWMGVMGAFWRRPEGPDSSVRGRAHHAAVHISWNDAHAYCEWAGRRLPTELEWEFAARGGLEDEPFPWGDATHDMHARLNAWEGEFPNREYGARRARRPGAGRRVRAQRVRDVQHGRERVGMVRRRHGREAPDARRLLRRHGRGHVQPRDPRVDAHGPDGRLGLAQHGLPLRELARDEEERRRARTTRSASRRPAERARRAAPRGRQARFLRGGRGRPAEGRGARAGPRVRTGQG